MLSEARAETRFLVCLCLPFSCRRALPCRVWHLLVTCKHAPPPPATRDGFKVRHTLVVLSRIMSGGSAQRGSGVGTLLPQAVGAATLAPAVRRLLRSGRARVGRFGAAGGGFTAAVAGWRHRSEVLTQPTCVLPFLGELRNCFLFALHQPGTLRWLSKRLRRAWECRAQVALWGIFWVRQKRRE